MRVLVIVFAALIVFLQTCPAWAIDPYAGVDPYWVLLHEPAVIEELQIVTTQRQTYQKILDDLDARFFRCRNKSAEVAQAEMKLVIAEVQKKLKPVLKSKQHQRLSEILLWRSGLPALARDDVAARLRFSETQRKRIQEALTKTQMGMSEIEKEVKAGKPLEPLANRYRELKADEEQELVKVLTSEQRTKWTELIGQPFDVSELGFPAFKAPELVNTNDWINSKPLTLQKLRGKVVVVHFYASGCINCIHNYPWYLEWQERFRDKEFVMIGIHTPETESERNSENVRQKATAAKFNFPVLIDGKSENWNAWGNSMWPSVYVIDQRGYVRFFWPGELKWQGNDGEKFLREQIEKLLTESI